MTSFSFWEANYALCIMNYALKKEQYVTEVNNTALPLSSAVRTGLEPATSGVTGRHSNQLNYRTKFPLVRVAPGIIFPFADAKLQQIFYSRKFSPTFF